MNTSTILPLQTPKDVSLAEIQAELGKIWTSKSETAAARAATFNLIVYEALDPERQFPSASVDAIASQNPCRVVDLRAIDGAGGDVISAQVAAYCPIGQARSSLVCCEYITLQASPTALERATSTVGALLISDLPSFLWWQGDLDLDSRLFQRLVDLSHRIIVDSSTFVYPEEDLQEMEQLVQEGNYCGDLNWRRLTSWQELAAQAFDPPEYRSSLRQIDRVSIDYNNANYCQAMLYVGWLASRLGWRPLTHIETTEHDYRINRITFSNGDRTVEAELVAVPTVATVPGELIGLRLSSSDPTVDACTVLCSENTGCMRMEVGGGAQACRMQQVSPLEHQTADQLLSQQLQRTSHDQLYEESLMVVKEILTAHAS